MRATGFRILLAVGAMLSFELAQIYAGNGPSKPIILPTIGSLWICY